jgi:hypothetical protein
MLAVENPKYDEIRRYILQAYNRATGSNLEEDIKSNDDRLIAVVGWLNDLVVNGNFNALFLGWKPVGAALFSPDLSSKASILSQFHCPLCKGGAPIGTINIRIPPSPFKQHRTRRLRRHSRGLSNIDFLALIIMATNTYVSTLFLCSVKNGIEWTLIIWQKGSWIVSKE